MKNIHTDREHSTKAAQTELPDSKQTAKVAQTQEIKGPKGPEPTRFGDWERKGRCVDF